MKKNCSVIILAALSMILLTGFTCRAAGAEWVYFATTAEGTHYYDKHAVKEANATITVSEKTVLSEGAKRSKEKFLRATGEYKGQAPGHVITVSEFNCAAAKSRSISMVIYDSDGKYMAGSPAGGSPWRDLAPGTLHERLSQLICK